MGVEVPKRLMDEFLDVVALVTPGKGISVGKISTQDEIDAAISQALLLWAQRGNPVNDELDQMIERAVRKAMTGWEPGDE